MSPKPIKSKGRKPKGSMTVVPSAAAPDKYCGAARRQQPGACTRPSGWGTDHVGQGRCKLHGGATPIRHGRYSTIKRDGIRELIAHHEADPDPLNIFPELAAARALFQDFIERYDDWREAILAWWESYDARQRPLSQEKIQAFESLLDDYEDAVKGSTGELTDRQATALAAARGFILALRTPWEIGRPRQVLDLSDAYRIVSEITKIAERIEKVRAANAISRPDLLRVMAEMGRVVEAHVKDADARERITEGWLAIRVA